MGQMGEISVTACPRPSLLGSSGNLYDPVFPLHSNPLLSKRYALFDLAVGTRVPTIIAEVRHLLRLFPLVSLLLSFGRPSCIVRRGDLAPPDVLAAPSFCCFPFLSLVCAAPGSPVSNGSSSTLSLLTPVRVSAPHTFQH